MPIPEPEPILPTKIQMVLHTDVVALNGGLGGTETQTDVLEPSPALASLLALRLGLRVEEDVRLLLERTFRLDGQLGRHGCEVSVDKEAVSSWGVWMVVGEGCGGRRRWGGRFQMRADIAV